MSWIALIDKTRALFRADGLARLGQTTAPANSSPNRSLNAPLPKGSLLIETRVSPYDRPQTLVGFAPQRAGGVGLSLQAVPGGGIVLILNRNGATFHAAINLDTGGRADVLRITYSWDTETGLGRLALERPGTFRVALRDLVDPIPLSAADMREFVHDETARVVSADVSYVAMSNRIEPIGPMPSLTAATPVMTANGYMPVGELKRGDVVQSISGHLVPVLKTVKRTVPAAGLFAPLKLRAPFFGLTQPIITGPTQRLVIGGSRVEYTFGSEFVLIPAGHLIHGMAAQPSKGAALVTYCQLILPDHEAVLSAGTYLESLDLGRLRRRRDTLKASLLSQFPRTDLPEHSRTAYPVLREFEALTLAAQRAA